jgi:hypothetical protein
MQIDQTLCPFADGQMFASDNIPLARHTHDHAQTSSALLAPFCPVRRVVAPIGIALPYRLLHIGPSFPNERISRLGRFIEHLLVERLALPGEALRGSPIATSECIGRAGETRISGVAESDGIGSGGHVLLVRRCSRLDSREESRRA